MLRSLVSPWKYRATDHRGRAVNVSITFNASTGAIGSPGMVAVRESGCLYNQILLGRDPSKKVFSLNTGSTTISPAQLSAAGFTTINQIVSLNFTTGISGT